jgi:hypothetical protein
MHGRFLPLALLCCLLPGRGSAAERGRNDAGVTSVPHFDDRRWQAEIRFGGGTTVGLLGLVGEVNLLDRMALGAGLGFNELGAALGAHARWRALVFRGRQSLHALTIELAYSQTRYAGQPGLVPSMCDGSPDDPQSSCFDPPVVPVRAHWAQLEFGWEARLPSAFTLRVATGGAWLLHRIDWRCEFENAEAPCRSDPDPAVPVVTLALGHAF